MDAQLSRALAVTGARETFGEQNFYAVEWPEHSIGGCFERARQMHKPISFNFLQSASCRILEQPHQRL